MASLRLWISRNPFSDYIIAWGGKQRWEWGLNTGFFLQIAIVLHTILGMLFNSMNFFYFLIPTLLVFWAINEKYRQVFILTCSYIYLATYSPIYCVPLLISTFVDYFFSLKIYTEKRNKKKYLYLSILFNLSLLFYFKYFLLFNEILLKLFGLELDVSSFISLNRSEELILPIGISFYTFQTLSYTFDVYNERIKPTRNLIEYALYVSYFPQMIAGPIEKASYLIPKLSFKDKLKDINFSEASYYFTLGLFKKVCVSNNLRAFTEAVYTTPESNIMTIILSGLVYYVRIYCDFSGYVDMARGLSLLFGVRLSVNFSTPYLKTSISEFWRQWHITLSTWIRDYIYIPLGGSRHGKFRTYINLFIAITVAGVWHGPALVYVIFGLYHSLMVSIDHLFKNFKVKVPNFLSFPLTFITLCIGFAIFNLKSYDWLLGVFSFSPITEDIFYLNIFATTISLVYFIPVFILEFFKFESKSNVYKYSSVLALLVLVLIFGNYSSSSFEYFRF